MGYLNKQDLLNVLRHNPERSNTYGIPEIKPELEWDPCSLFMGYNYAKNTKEYDKTVHFFLEDYMFAQVWNTPEKNMEALRPYYAVCTPDFSMYRDMPIALQIFNVYRSRWCGSYWQSQGLKVIPTVSWSTEESYSFCFAGLPQESVIAVSGLGSQRDPIARALFDKGWAEMISRLNPKTILLYGTTRKDLPGNIIYVGTTFSVPEEDQDAV